MGANIIGNSGPASPTDIRPQVFTDEYSLTFTRDNFIFRHNPSHREGRFPYLDPPYWLKPGGRCIFPFTISGITFPMEFDSGTASRYPHPIAELSGSIANEIGIERFPRFGSRYLVPISSQMLGQFTAIVGVNDDPKHNVVTSYLGNTSSSMDGFSQCVIRNLVWNSCFD